MTRTQHHRRRLTLRDLAWRVKTTARWSPPVLPRLTLRRADRLSKTFTPSQRKRYAQLESRYDLSAWATCLTKREYAENLYVLDICDSQLGAEVLAGPGLDIGSRNGVYLRALATFLNTAWTGVEIDAYRRYWNLSTREAYAKHVLRNLPHVHYRPASLLDVAGEFGLVTWFLPFLFAETQQRWGLPRRFFQPLNLLDHAWQLLAPGGTLFIINQGQEEFHHQGRLFRACGIDATPVGTITSLFSPYRKQRLGWLATKTIQH